MIRFLHQPRIRALTLAGLLILAVAPLAAHPTRAHATSTPPPPLFATSFESGQPQPTWANTVDDNGWGGGRSNVAGICCGLSGPEVGVRQETANSGALALMYSGLDTGPTQSFAYDKVFDVSTRALVIGPTTTLSYWIYPQGSATAPVPVSGGNSTCVAIDMIFADGSDLRDSGVTDQNGVRLHPAAQCGHLTLNTWNHVVALLGSTLAGKTIARINVGYDQPANTGGYRGYIDDITVGNTAPSPAPSPTPSPTPNPSSSSIPTSGTTSNGCAITPDQATAEQHLLTLLNQHRAAVGVAPLQLNQTLSLASRQHSCDMYQHQNMSHTGSDGSSPFDRMRAVGITFSTAGENIGATWGYALTNGVDTTDSGMMAEPGNPGDHHWNIVNAGYTQVGIGIIYANSQLWLTEDFVG